MSMVTGSALLAFFLIKLSLINGNIDCNTVSDEPYSVSAKDFKISRKDVKSLFCYSFFCSLSSEPIKLLLNSYVHNKSYSTLVYSGTDIVSIANNCSFCQDNINGKEDNSTCNVCPSVPESRNDNIIEIHIRIDKPSEKNINGDYCQFEDFFNITVFGVKNTENKTIYCKDGHNVSLPVDSEFCSISNKSEITQACIKPSCFDKIKSESISVGTILHQFPKSKYKEACIFQIKSDSNPVEIFYSPNIKDSLIIYGSTLHTPKWNLANCDDSHSKIRINPTEKSFYIVYKNEGELIDKGSLSIIPIEENLCNNPPLLENGRTEVFIENNHQFIQFNCNEGFLIVGMHKLRCDEAVIEDIPMCIIIDKDNHFDNQSHTISNTTLLESERPTTLASVLPQTSTNTSSEGSGAILIDDLSSDYATSVYDEASFNFTLFNTTGEGNYDLKLFKLPSFKENMLIFILIGVGFCLIIIITIVSAVVLRNKGSCRSNIGRQFDTFQNPIYEKPVQVPITGDNGELCQDKIDLGDLSESTVLE